MIVRASVSHFKSLSEASLRFRPLNVIVGPNGSGKSNILDALYFLHDCAVDDIDSAITKRHGIDSIRQWSKTKPYNITTSLEFSSALGNGTYRLVISSNKGNYRIVEEQGTWTGRHPSARFRPGREEEVHTSSFHRSPDGRVSIYSKFLEDNHTKAAKVDPDDLFVTALGNRLPVLSYVLFRPIWDELSSFSKYNIYPNTLREPQLVSKYARLSENGSNLTSVLKRVNNTRRFARNKEDILASLRSLMPAVTDFQIKSAAGYYVPVLRVEESTGEGHDFNLSQISDGTLRALGLLTAFYQPDAPDKIGIEEPEQMIHPGALSVLAESARDYVSANRDRQVFITTHSPTFLDLVEPESIIWARMRNGITKSGKISKRHLEIVKSQLFSAGEILLAEGFFA